MALPHSFRIGRAGDSTSAGGGATEPFSPASTSSPNGQTVFTEVNNGYGVEVWNTNINNSSTGIQYAYSFQIPGSGPVTIRTLVIGGGGAGTPGINIGSGGGAGGMESLLVATGGQWINGYVPTRTYWGQPGQGARGGDAIARISPSPGNSSQGQLIASATGGNGAGDGGPTHGTSGVGASAPTISGSGATLLSQGTGGNRNAQIQATSNYQNPSYPGVLSHAGGAAGHGSPGGRGVGFGGGGGVNCGSVGQGGVYGFNGGGAYSSGHIAASGPVPGVTQDPPGQVSNFGGTGGSYGGAGIEGWAGGGGAGGLVRVWWGDASGCNCWVNTGGNYVSNA